MNSATFLQALITICQTILEEIDERTLANTCSVRGTQFGFSGHTNPTIDLHTDLAEIPKLQALLEEKLEIRFESTDGKLIGDWLFDDTLIRVEINLFVPPI
jgi:hypothetical protein